MWSDGHWPLCVSSNRCHPLLLLCMSCNRLVLLLLLLLLCVCGCVMQWSAAAAVFVVVLLWPVAAAVCVLVMQWPTAAAAATQPQAASFLTQQCIRTAEQLLSLWRRTGSTGSTGTRMQRLEASSSTLSKGSSNMAPVESPTTTISHHPPTQMCHTHQHV